MERERDEGDGKQYEIVTLSQEGLDKGIWMKRTHTSKKRNGGVRSTW